MTGVTRCIPSLGPRPLNDHCRVAALGHVTTEWGKSWLVCSSRWCANWHLALPGAAHCGARVPGRRASFRSRRAWPSPGSCACCSSLDVTTHPSGRSRVGVQRSPSTAAALALFAVWTLLSRGLVGRARPGADRVRSRAAVPARARVHRPARARPRAPRGRSCAGSALAIAVACAVALPPACCRRRSRPAPGVNNERLAFPLTYWNAMGMFCGARRDPADAPHGLGARAGGGARRGGRRRCRSSR